MSKNTDLGNLVNGLFVSSTRNVGIGMSTPANAVVVDKGTATASYLQFTAGTTTGQLATDGFEVGIDASGNGIISQQENLPLMMYTNSAERLRITAAGNVGIGTTNPSQLLEVNGSSETLGISMNIRNSFDGADSTKYSGINFLMGSDNGTSAIRAYRTNSAADFQTNLTFWTKGAGAGATSPTERMRITSAGAVGINTSSPNSSTVLTLQQSATLSGAISFLNRNSTQRFSIAVDAAAVDDKCFSIIDNNAAAVRMAITSGGNIGIGTTTANSRLTVFGNIELIPPTTSNAKIRLVTCHGDGGTNTVQVYWGIAFGGKAAGGCLGAYDSGGNYASPSTTISNSSLWTIYGFIGV